MILSVQTDQPQAVLVLSNTNGEIIEQYTWLADRQLAATLLTEIAALLERHHTAQEQLTGLIVYKGPGSFTGLRIGITVANTMAYSLHIPIVGTQGDNWVREGLKKLSNHANDMIVMPEYGSEANITQPAK